MNKAERLAPPVYSTKYTPEGVTLTITSQKVVSTLDIRDANPKTPAGHEAFHIGITKADDVDVNKASIVPSPTLGYAAYTEPLGFSAAGAAASGANGGNGDSHDRRLIQAHGYDYEPAAKRSKELLHKGNTRRKVNAYATELNARGTIDNAEINEIDRQVEEETIFLATKPQVIDVYARTTDGNSVEVTNFRTANGQPQLADEVEQFLKEVAEQKRKEEEAKKIAVIEEELKELALAI